MGLIDELILSLTPEPKSARVFVIEPSDAFAESLAHILTDRDLHDIAMQAHEPDRTAMVVSRGLLRLGVCSLTGCSPEDARIVRDDAGRPRIAGFERVEMDLNISRRRGCAAIAVSRGGRCGIDVEAIGDEKEHRDVLNAMRAQGIRVDEEDSPEGVYRRWCSYESVLKADGRGLGARLDDVRSTGRASQSGEQWVCGAVIWTLSAISVPEGYVGMVAVENGLRLSHAPMRTHR
ncbi:MAG: 4'-phosphopantetheinyl transferase family protein [Phycisphaerales bacterium]